jgi:hypothetical protein
MKGVTYPICAGCLGAMQVRRCGFTCHSVHRYGFTCHSVRRYGFTCHSVRRCGFTCHSVRRWHGLYGLPFLQPCFDATSVQAPPADLLVDAFTQAGTGNTSSAPLTSATANKNGVKGTISMTYRLLAGMRAAGAAVGAGAAASVLTVQVGLPANSQATTVLPLFVVDPSKVTITEGATTVWSKGAYVPGCEGVTSARVVEGAVHVEHGSGFYAFSVAYPALVNY